MSTPVTPGGGVWAEMAGQTRAIASFSKAARAARALLRATTQAFTDSTEPPTATLSTDKTATLDRGGTADLEPGTLPPENSENAKPHKGNSMALRNLKERLTLMYDSDAKIQSRELDGTFRVDIRLPYRKKTSDVNRLFG